MLSANFQENKGTQGWPYSRNHPGAGALVPRVPPQEAPETGQEEKWGVWLTL